MSTITIGVDVGQRAGYSAIAVAELDERGRRRDDQETDHWIVRHLERLTVGASYPEVATRLHAVVQGVGQQIRQRAVEQWPPGDGSWDATLYADVTGLGAPVIKALTAGAGEPITPVYFTYGDRRTEERGVVTMGKAWLVARLQVLLQMGRLHLPQTADAATLTKELLDYQVTVEADANERYGAFAVGSRDDLVTAIGLAVQARPAYFGPMDPVLAAFLTGRTWIDGWEKE